MSKLFWHAPSWSLVASKSSRTNQVINALCLGAAALLPLNASAVRGEGTAPAATQEASVLVATHESATAGETTAADAAGPENSDSLTPVAQSSDSTPELANSYDGLENTAKPADATGQPATAAANSSTPSTEDAIDAPSAEVSQQFDATAAAATEGLPAETVKFQGMLVGSSTRQELLDRWGKPAETVETSEGQVLAFEIRPFQAVEVLIGERDVVAAIKIALASPLDPKQLAEQLSLGQIQPVTAYDETDQPLGQAFPERGVLFMFHASEADALAGDSDTLPTVSHVVLQHLDPLAFAMRAESQLHGPYTRNIQDLKTAVKLDPQCAHAQALLAKVYLATGQADLACEAATAACEIEQDNLGYQLLRGRAQELIGDYDDAVLTVRAVLDNADVSPIDKAQALYQMGCLASLGDAEIASKAISFHTRAIEAADPLANGDSGKQRRAAKQILVDAHMAIAEEVARQAFNQKVENLSLWIGRASGIAEDYIENDGGSVELRLMIAQRALAALASFRPTLDPAPWVAEADEAAQKLLAQCDDELWQSRIKWELGLTYLNALRVEHMRRETPTAIRFGDTAVEYLAQGASTRQAVHSSEQLIGLLYFQIGAVHAVHQLDHVKAAQWYDKAEPLLTGPQPKSELYAPRREGEMLVSMGVTYWQIGEKDRAITLTRNGVNLVESAVNAGILAKSTLGVPYGNLATMYQKMGESANAEKYAELSRTVASSKPARVNDPQDIRQTSNTGGNGPSSAQRPRSMSPKR